jgi:PKD repeat protein
VGIVLLFALALFAAPVNAYAYPSLGELHGDVYPGDVLQITMTEKDICSLYGLGVYAGGNSHYLWQIRPYFGSANPGATYYSSYPNSIYSNFTVPNTTAPTMYLHLMAVCSDAYSRVGESWTYHNYTESHVPIAGLTTTPVVVFTDTSMNNPTSWYWNFGDGSSSILKNPQHTYQSPGTYVIIHSASNSKGTSWINETAYIDTSYNSVFSPITVAALMASSTLSTVDTEVEF